MARVVKHVASKDFPKYGISKGQTYYQWSVWRGGRAVVNRSLTYPTRSQVTSSEFLQQLYALMDSITPDTFDESSLESTIEEVESMAEELRSKFDNMPEALQQGSTGRLVEERADALEGWVEELRQLTDSDIESELDEGTPEEEREVGLNRIRAERAQACAPEL